MANENQENPNTVVQVSNETSSEASQEEFEITLPPPTYVAGFGAAFPGSTSLLTTGIEAITFDSYTPELVNQNTEFGEDANFRFILKAKKTGTGTYEIYGRDDENSIGTIDAQNSKEFKDQLKTLIGATYGAALPEESKDLDAISAQEIGTIFGEAGAIVEGDKVVAGDLDQLNKVVAEVDQRAQQQAYDFLEKLSGYGAQNFFMENVIPFVKKAKNESRAGGYNPYIKLVSSDNPADILHIMTSQKQGLRAFNEGRALDYSLIYPYIRVFMETNDGSEIEIPFSSYMSQYTSDSFLKSREGRADDVGIIDLSWNYDAGDIGTFARGDSGEVSLRIYFQTAESIFKTRKAKGGVKYNFSEFLAVRGSKDNADEVYLYDKSRVRIVVGYDYEPKAIKHGSSTAFFEAAGKVRKSLLCTPSQEYDLDVQEDGSMIIDFKYHFASENIIKDSTFDILDRRKLNSLKKDIQEIENQIEHIEQQGIGAENESTAPILSSPEQESAAEDNAALNDLRSEKDKISQEYKKTLSDLYKGIRESILQRAFKVSFQQGALQNYLYLRQIAKGTADYQKLPDGQHYWNRSKDLNTERIKPSPFSTKTNPELLVSKEEGGREGPGGAARSRLEDTASEPVSEKKVEKSAEVEVYTKQSLETKTPIEKEAASNTSSPGDKNTPDTENKASVSGQENTTMTGNEDVELYFVYLGDLIGAFLEQPSVKESMNKENYTIVLGQILMSEVLANEKNTADASGIAINLGDLPISLDAINGWFTENFVKPQVESMTLHQFFYTLNTGLITNILNNSDTIRGGDILRSRIVRTSYFSSTDPPNKIIPAGRNKLTGVEFFNQSTAVTPTPKKNKYNYLILSTDPVGLHVSGNATEEFDSQIGRNHYYLASDKGLLKKASFSKETLGPEIRVLNIAAAAAEDDGSGLRFWEPMSVNMELFGTPFLEPYSIFFLNPSMPGMGSIVNKDSPAYKLQIGGYYHMMKIENKISDGIWTSNVEASRALGRFSYEKRAVASRKIIHKPIS